MKNIILTALAVIITLSFSSCKKDKEDPQPETLTGAMLIKFEHTFGSEAFTLNTPYYHTNTPVNDTLTFSTFKYYVSNIALTRTDGSIWKQPESYYLINAADAKEGICSITLQDIPEAEYTDITFTVGVDSTRNVSGAQEGALDPTLGMFWSWNTGYIFFKAEGIYKYEDADSSFVYHVGGFKNANNSNAIQSKTFSLGPVPVPVNPGASPQIHYLVDVEKMFAGPGMDLNVREKPMHMMSNETGVNISKNYIEMFKFDHVHK